MIEKKYQVMEGEFGTKQIREFGRCDGGSTTVELILADQSHGRLVHIPHTRGVVWKAFDGRKAREFQVRPSTIAKTFQCVKVSATVQPLAPEQSGGQYNGSTVCTYEIVYQQVGAL